MLYDPAITAYFQLPDLCKPCVSVGEYEEALFGMEESRRQQEMHMQRERERDNIELTRCSCNESLRILSEEILFLLT